MKLDMLIKSACDDWSAEAQVPAGLADRALRRRTRRRTPRVVLAAGSTALLVGVGVAVVSVAGPTRQPSQSAIQPVPLSADTTLRTDLSSSFPRRLVAAGHTAVAAYYTTHMRSSGNGPKAIERTWHLYSPASGTYQKTSWAYLDVAPGMHHAAVLEALPSSRVGILDMKTQRVTRWIPVGHPVGGVAWSPEGRRLLLTSYDRNPDVNGAPGSSSRTGFYVVDAGSGQGGFHALPADRDRVGSRQDLFWSRNGTLIWTFVDRDPGKVFYDLNGARRPAPAHEAEWSEEAGLSPNGTLRPRFGPRPGPAVTITNVTTGKAVAVLPIQQAKAWADDDRLFAFGCAAKQCKGKGEFRNRLLLVSLDGKITPLTGYRRSDRPGAWYPVFTHR
ncbi:WD40 repeat domain-containing protein [Actinomadura alba]|uniref:WD40 repeat domain-containing protein n=1 Tax=Actinomadura alba TaxID=406431 RepID=A0ABR7LX20_9ACTN|nr:WD40 repeat domain-containing protein [Actinomadura alba]MBC6469402.1 WD40 repeat domain-containing protein [Actinomadura alba]